MYTSYVHFYKNYMSDIHFENIDKVIISYLNNSQKSLKIAVAWITDSNLLAAINNCLRRKIDVTIIFYDDKINNKDRFENLYRNGAKIYYTKKLMHNKFCIIDEEITLNGSFNWTKAAKKNDENIQVNHSYPISNKFLIEFKRLISEAQNINKYFADNENEFLIFVEKIGYPKSYPVFYKQELNTGLKSLFNKIKDQNIKYVYVYCSNRNDYLEFQKSIYDYFHTLKKYTFSHFLVASRYNYSRWNEEYKENGFTKSFERISCDFFIIIDIITQINKQFKFVGNDYNLIENRFSTDQFIYLKDRNFFLLGIEYNALNRLEKINGSVDLNSILCIKITKPNTDLAFEDLCLLKETSFYFDKNELILESSSFFNFDVGDSYASKSYSYNKLTFIKFPVIEIDKNKTEEEKKEKYNFCHTEHLKYKEKLEQERRRMQTEKYNKEKELKEKQCYIATMVYGDVNHYKVQLLRNYRDNYLRDIIIGRLFIKLYYATAPILVKNFNNKSFIKFSKYLIEMLIKRLKNYA